MVKKRVHKPITEEQIDAFAGMAEGLPSKTTKKAQNASEGVSRTTISLPKGLMTEIELRAFQNKQNGIEPKSVSALIRAALESYMKN